MTILSEEQVQEIRREAIARSIAFRDETFALCDAITPLRASLAAEKARAEKAEDFILRQGYTRCDIPACNCGQWHGGYAERHWDDIRDAVAEAGVSLKGGTTMGGVKQLIAERDAYRKAWTIRKACQDERDCSGCLANAPTGACLEEDFTDGLEPWPAEEATDGR